jgi:hypothetical protein
MAQFSKAKSESRALPSITALATMVGAAARWFQERPSLSIRRRLNIQPKRRSNPIPPTLPSATMSLRRSKKSTKVSMHTEEDAGPKKHPKKPMAMVNQS